MASQLITFIVVTGFVGILLALVDGYVTHLGGPGTSWLKRWLVALGIGVVVSLIVFGIASMF